MHDQTYLQDDRVISGYSTEEVGGLMFRDGNGWTMIPSSRTLKYLHTRLCSLGVGITPPGTEGELLVSGDVGIGTTDPGAKLDVHGKIITPALEISKWTLVTELTQGGLANNPWNGTSESGAPSILLPLNTLSSSNGTDLEIKIEFDKDNGTTIKRFYKGWRLDEVFNNTSISANTTGHTVYGKLNESDIGLHKQCQIQIIILIVYGTFIRIMLVILLLILTDFYYIHVGNNKANNIYIQAIIVVILHGLNYEFM